MSVEKNNSQDPGSQPLSSPISSGFVARSLFGGTLMGLANLVPGISGGTMLLVAGVYPEFIRALSELSRFRFKRSSFVVLGCIGIAAGLAILLLAGLLRDLVLDYRWVMYSLFIGLTFGGLPLLWKMAQPISKNVIVAAVISFAGMAALAYLQAQRETGTLAEVTTQGDGNLSFVLAGLVAASAMILPGVSGAYLLMVMGKHIPILHSIDQFKSALTNRSWEAMLVELNILLPVAIGAGLGIVLTGNSLKWLLQRYPKVVLGVLIGLLLGSVCGLYPYQDGVPPQLGDILEGRLVTAETIGQIDKKDWLTVSRTPSLGEALGGLLLIGAGLFLTRLMSKLVGEDQAA